MTPAEKLLWEQRLAQAEQAYHLLLTGQSAVTVRDQNGESITYNTASLSRLAAYIDMIRKKLGLESRGSGKPMGVIY